MLDTQAAQILRRPDAAARARFQLRAAAALTRRRIYQQSFLLGKNIVGGEKVIGI